MVPGEGALFGGCSGSAWSGASEDGSARESARDRVEREFRLAIVVLDESVRWLIPVAGTEKDRSGLRPKRRP